MSLLVTVQDVQPAPGARVITRIYKIQPVQGTNYVTGGDTVNFLTATAPVGNNNALTAPQPRVKCPPYLAALFRFDIQSTPSLYQGELLQNAVNPTMANFLLKIISAATAAELAAGAYPAGLYNDAFYISLTSPKKYG